MGHLLYLAALEPAAWVSEHPIATLALLLCGALVLARAFFLYTRAFLDRFEELPDPRSLSTPELVVLANPRELTRAHLARMDRRWRGAGRVAVLVAAGTLALLGADVVLGRETPRDALLARLDAERMELHDELEHDARLAPDLAASTIGVERGARSEELAVRLERTLEGLAARADRAAFDADEEARVELAASTLARARGRFAAVLDLVPEERLERASEETERKLEREAALLVERARALSSLGEARRALPLFERALALRPTRRDVALELAQGYVVCGRFDAALAQLEECVPALARDVLELGHAERAAELVRALALEGEARVELADDERAHAAFSRALELMQRGELFEPSARLDADLARLLRARGMVAARLAHMDDARLDLERALSMSRALAPAASGSGGAHDLAELLLAHARLLAEAGAADAALAELDEARALVAPDAGRDAHLESDPRRLLPVEIELAAVRVLNAQGELERAHERLDAQLEALDAEPASRPELDRLRADAALLHAGFGLAARAPELALADVARALELLAREAGRTGSDAELDGLHARANELRAQAIALAAPGIEPGAEIEPPAVAVEPAAAEAVAPAPIDAASVVDEPELEPLPPDPVPLDQLRQLELRLAAWDVELAGEEDARLLAAPVDDLLARAGLLVARGEAERAMTDLDRAVHLLRERLGVEPLESDAARTATLALARAMGTRGGERARAGRFTLAFRDFDERVTLLGGRTAEVRDAEHARALADALRERALVAFNQRDRSEALADLDAALAFVESWLGALGDGLATGLDERLADLRRERALVEGAGAAGGGR